MVFFFQVDPEKQSLAESSGGVSGSSHPNILISSPTSCNGQKQTQEQTQLTCPCSNAQASDGVSHCGFVTSPADSNNFGKCNGLSREEGGGGGGSPPRLEPSVVMARRQRQRAVKIDEVCRVVFPFGFVIFNIMYWTYYRDEEIVSPDASS